MYNVPTIIRCQRDIFRFELSSNLVVHNGCKRQNIEYVIYCVPYFEAVVFPVFCNAFTVETNSPFKNSSFMSIWLQTELSKTELMRQNETVSPRNIHVVADVWQQLDLLREYYLRLDS